MNRLFCNLCNCFRGGLAGRALGCDSVCNNNCCRNCHDCHDCRNCHDCCDCHDCHDDDKIEFKSSYLEALGNQQEVELGGSFVFDAVDKVGDDIELVGNTEFVLKTKGLYQVTWSANIVADSNSLIGIAENDVPTSALTGNSGVTSSGALVKVGKTPVVVTLRSFGGEVSAVCPPEWINTAVSVRIIKFADGVEK